VYNGPDASKIRLKNSNTSKHISDLKQNISDLKPYISMVTDIALAEA